MQWENGAYMWEEVVHTKCVFSVPRRPVPVQHMQGSKSTEFWGTPNEWGICEAQSEDKVSMSRL